MICGDICHSHKGFFTVCTYNPKLTLNRSTHNFRRETLIFNQCLPPFLFSSVVLSSYSGGFIPPFFLCCSYCGWPFFKQVFSWSGAPSVVLHLGHSFLLTLVFHTNRQTTNS